ncbi:SDR family oxidoreductase [Nocardioides sp. B-3]|nr:SDR family oxidoreductase [Nocardioides sp. B-3]UUZ58476.1 SDR family oxidoreductase [Nocardioides sp. B-3]
MTDMFRLDGKVAIVTGASSGIGVAFAQSLAEAGADVVLGARRVDKLADTAKLVEAAGRRALTVATDVADPAQCRAPVDAAMAEFGRVDVLVNNAGVGTAVPATHETPEQFRSVIDVNLNGCYWMAQACGRVMQPGSSIINISSVLGITTGGLPRAAYSASKAGLNGLTRDPGPAVDGAQGHPGQLDRPGLLRVGDDRHLPRRLPRSRDDAGPCPPQGRPGRARRDRGLPGLPRGRLHHRPDHPGRRRDDDRLRAARSHSLSAGTARGSGRRRRAACRAGPSRRAGCRRRPVGTRR